MKKEGGWLGPDLTMSGTSGEAPKGSPKAPPTMSIRSRHLKAAHREHPRQTLVSQRSSDNFQGECRHLPQLGQETVDTLFSPNLLFVLNTGAQKRAGNRSYCGM